MSCANTCDELGRAAREAEEARVKVIEEGLNKKAGMVSEAKQRLEQKRVQLQEKEMRKVELEKIRDEAQALKEEAEKPEKEALDYYRQIEEEEKKRQEEEKAASEAAEAAEYFSQLDSDQDGQVTVAELQVNNIANFLKALVVNFVLSRPDMVLTPTRMARCQKTRPSSSWVTRRALISRASRTAASVSSSPILTSRRFSPPRPRKLRALCLRLRSIILQTIP